MAQHSIKTNWKENNTFETDLDGHKVAIDLGEESGGNDNGPRPKKLALVAASGCTGLDVIAILRKMRIEPENFDIRIDAEVSDEHPKTYTSMKITYEFEGDNLPKEKVERACKLSFDNYCGVIALFKKAIPVTYEVIIKNL